MTEGLKVQTNVEKEYRDLPVEMNLRADIQSIVQEIINK